MMAFWAAFLLVHLGGPDAITALSMEDNALWTRHPIALIAQLSVFVYIFVKTLPDNRLLVPTILICVTGVINYGERTRALYLASSGNLRKIIEKDPVLEESEVSLVFHRILTGLIVNMVPDLHDCQMSQKHILSYHPLHIRHSISWELKHLFELFYTKMKAANTRWGMIARAVTLYSTLAAFILFCNGHKHQFHGGDLVITYALFAGAFVIHLANMIIALSSVVKNSSSPKETILMFLGQGIFPPLVIYALVGIIATCAGGTALGDLFIRRDPPKKMASFNILSHCFKQITLKKGRKPGFIWNKLTRARHVSREHVDPSLQRSVWMYIRENAAGATDEAIMREFYEARGDQALRSIDQLRPYIEGLPYEKTLLIWHIATEICVNMEAGEDYIDNDDRKKMRMYSKKLSDYMMYLLVWRPKLMYALAGISHIRCNETYAELKLLGEKLEVPTMQQFCELILRECVDIVDPDVEENNDTFSVLKVSCMLVGLIRENNDRWEVIYKVWLEMLSYTAGHCSGESHARQLSEGGEFVTTIWILMSLCGIGDQFPVNYDTRFSYRPV